MQSIQECRRRVERAHHAIADAERAVSAAVTDHEQGAALQKLHLAYVELRAAVSARAAALRGVGR